MKKITEVPHRSIDWGKVVSIAALLPLGMALVTAAGAPATAQSTIIIEGGYYPSDGYYHNGGYGYPNNGYYPPRTNQPPQAAPFVYGSPIPTPMPVDPNTGLTPRNNNTYSYPAYPNPYGNRVQDSTIVNPVLVNPRIRDSTIVNPTIVDDPRYEVPDGRYYRRSRGIKIRDRY